MSRTDNHVFCEKLCSNITFSQILYSQFAGFGQRNPTIPLFFKTVERFTRKLKKLILYRFSGGPNIWNYIILKILLFSKI